MGRIQYTKWSGSKCCENYSNLTSSLDLSLKSKIFLNSCSHAHAEKIWTWIFLQLFLHFCLNNCRDSDWLSIWQKIVSNKGLKSLGRLNSPPDFPGGDLRKAVAQPGSLFILSAQLNWWVNFLIFYKNFSGFQEKEINIERVQNGIYSRNITPYDDF